MDPRLRSILLTLLQMMVESETQTQMDPMMQPPPDRKNPYPPGTLGYNLKEMAAPDRHAVWPFQPQVTDFGNA